MSRSPSAKIPTRPYNNSNNFERTPKSTSHSKNSKFLTLDQLTKLIEEIMLEKRKFNVRCLTKNEPF